MKKNDVYIFKDSIKIGKCKISIRTQYKKYNSNVEDIKNFLVKNKKIIKNNLSLPKTIIIDIKAIKGEICGEANEISRKKSKYKITLDVRDSIYNVCETLIHELIHIHQYATGDLKVKWDYKKEDWLFIWKGTKVHIKDESCHEEYLSLPWERQAYNKTAKLIKLFKI